MILAIHAACASNYYISTSDWVQKVDMSDIFAEVLLVFYIFCVHDSTEYVCKHAILGGFF